MVSDIQKRARNKWDSNNMTVLGCKIRKEDADAFKERCQMRGTTPNAVFRQAIEDFMLQDKTAPVADEDIDDCENWGI